MEEIGLGKNKKISIIVPAYNEALTLRTLIEEIYRNIRILDNDFEIIIVDDGSDDDTWKIARSCFDIYRQVRCVRFTRNFGKESAIYAGLKMSSGAAAIVMDADFQHPPELIPQMIDIWERTGVFLVEAVKERRQNESLFRKFGSHIFYKIFFKAAAIDIRNSSDFKLLDRKVIDQYLDLPENIRFFRGLVKWFAHSSCVVNFIPADRLKGQGKSRWSIKRLYDFARNSLISFTSFPLRLVTWFGLVTFLFSIILGIQTIWMKIKGFAVEGFTTVILTLLCIGSLIMLSLGLIGEYIARIYEEIKRRPIYVIRECMERKEEGSSL